MSGPGYRCILVTGASGDIADAVGRILGERYPDTRLVGADASAEWPGRAVFAEMHRLPLAGQPDYTTALTELTASCGAELVIPTSEPELRRLAIDAGAAALPLLMNPKEALLPFLDKLETANWLRTAGLPSPSTCLLNKADADHLPLVAKPIRSSGSRRILIVRTLEQLRAAQQMLGRDAVGQALLEPDEAEFTCAIVRPAGQPLFLAMRRKLLGGLSSEIRIEQHDQIDALMSAIDAALPGYVALNVQLRLTPEGPRIFEINPRISSTAMMRHRAGFEDVIWLIEARLGRPVPERFDPPVGLRVFRRFTEVTAPA